MSRRLDGLRNDVYFSLKPQQQEGDQHYCWSNRAIKCALSPEPQALSHHS